MEREPGQITASVTPRWTHSSTRVALKVACTLTRRGPPCRTAGTGPPLVLLHGFTQTGATVGSLRPAPGRLVHPGRSGPARARAGRTPSAPICPRRRDLVADATRDAVGGRALHAARVFARGAGGAARRRRERTCPCGRAVLVGGTGGHRGRAEARARRRQADEAHGRRARGIGRRGGFVESLARADRCSTGWRTERRSGTSGCGTAPAGLASSLRLCGTGTQEPLWGRCRALALPLLALAGPTTAGSPPTPCAWPRWHRSASPRCSRRAGTPSTWPNLIRRGRSRGARGSVVRPVRRPADVGSHQQADGEQDAHGELQAGRRPEHRQERGGPRGHSAPGAPGRTASGAASRARSDQAR